MKGIIAEINGSHMIVIAKNGDFIRCKTLPNCNIGDEVNIPARSIASIYRKLSTVAASFIILAMLSTGVYAYYTPYSYVSVDINPSLELHVNRFDRVIDVHAFNEDAQKLLATSTGLKNKGVDAAVEQIIDSAADEGYLKADAENNVMIVVSSKSKKEEAAISSKIGKSSTEALAKVSSDYEVILENTEIEKYNKAKEGNISPGKVILATKFKEVKPDIDEEKIKRMPLHQAIKQIEKKDDKEEKPNEPKPSAIGKKPDVKAASKNNVINVKELIKEKNEDLGKKLEQDKKEKEDKKNDKESFNQKDDASDKEKSDKAAGEEIKDKDSSDGKKNDEADEDKDEKKADEDKKIDEDKKEDSKEKEPKKDDKKKN